MLVPPGQQSNFSALHETWETSNSVRRADGHTLAFFNPYFQVRLPSRYHDPAIAPDGRPADRRVLRGDRRRRRARAAAPATQSTGDGQTAGVTFDDPRSAFNGADHFVDINANQLEQRGRAGGVVHRRVRAERADRARSPGSIRQRLSKMDNKIGVDAGGPVIGNNRNYAGAGVHAPN